MGKRNFDPPEGRKTQTCGHKSMVEGLTIMLGVFINLLCTYTMPNNHYCSTYMNGISPLECQILTECWQDNKIFAQSQARNLPTSGCKSMVEGVTIMLGVFITLLYIHTMPNIYYCSTFMLLYPHLMAKHCLTIGKKLDFSLIWGMKPANKWL